MFLSLHYLKLYQKGEVMSSEGPLKKQELQYLILSYLYIYDGAYRFLSSFAPVSDHDFEGYQNDFERSQSSFCDGL